MSLLRRTYRLYIHMYFGWLFIPFMAGMQNVAIATISAINLFLAAGILLVHVTTYKNDPYIIKMPANYLTSTTYFFASFVAFIPYFIFVDSYSVTFLVVSILVLFFSISYIETKGYL